MVLDYVENLLGKEGAKSLSESLMNNSTLTRLTIMREKIVYFSSARIVFLKIKNEQTTRLAMKEFKLYAIY